MLLITFPCGADAGAGASAPAGAGAGEGAGAGAGAGAGTGAAAAATESSGTSCARAAPGIPARIVQPSRAVANGVLAIVLALPLMFRPLIGIAGPGSAFPPRHLRQHQAVTRSHGARCALARGGASVQANFPEMRRRSNPYPRPDQPKRHSPCYPPNSDSEATSLMVTNSISASTKARPVRNAHS